MPIPIAAAVSTAPMLATESIFTDPSKHGDRPGSRFDSSRKPIKRARSSSSSVPLSSDYRSTEKNPPPRPQSLRKDDQRHANWRSSGSIDSRFSAARGQLARQLVSRKSESTKVEPRPYLNGPSAAAFDQPPYKKTCRNPRASPILADTAVQIGLLDRRSSTSTIPFEEARVCLTLPPHLSIFTSSKVEANETAIMEGNKEIKQPRSPGAPHWSRPGRMSRHQSVNANLGSPGLHGKSLSSFGGQSSGTTILQEIGASEILDQDDRPTFVIDLENHANFEPGPLQILFSNAALRSSTNTLSMVSGRGLQTFQNLSYSSDFNEFKAWVTSYVRNFESLDVPLPSFRYLGATWSCNTLRKRLRIIRGTFSPITTSFSKGSSANSDISSIRHDTRVRTPGSAMAEGSMVIDEEQDDYFSHSTSRSLRNNDLGKSTSSQGSSRDSSVMPVEFTPKMAETHNPKNLPLRQARRERDISDLSIHEITLRDVADAQAKHIERLTSDGFFDWTRLPVTPALPRHIQFAKSVDWASTSLGPIETWCDDLRSMCNLVMASPHPAAMYWGDDLIAIYNEPYILLAGQKHPQLMGQPYRDAWPEIWDSVEGVFADAKISGQSTMKDDDCLFIDRASGDGFLEETYFSWSIIPLIGADGSVVGLYNPAFEKTRRKIAERRMLTLRELGEKTSSAGDLQGFWKEVLEALASNPYDVPFVLIYSAVNQKDVSETSSSSAVSTGSENCVLEGALGLPEDHPLVPKTLDVGSGTSFLARTFQSCSDLDTPAFLRVDDGTLDMEIVDVMDLRGYPDPCKAAVCFPIHATSGDKVLGYVLMGINPRRPYDDDYSLFLQLLSRQLATTMASVMLFVEEIAKGKRAARRAAADKIQLSAELAEKKLQAQESEARFARMAEVATVGIFIANAQGQLVYSNDTWHEISHVPKGTQGIGRWMDAIKAEDRGIVESKWANLVENKIPFKDVEFRFNTSWKDPNGNQSDTWVLASAYPEKDGRDHLKIIFGSLTNISQQKWAGLIEKRHAEEARESKRQQENFIDITSHEMRNPLSAILQSADDITTSLTAFSAANGMLPKPITELLENSVDCAQTITLCAQHQKRIVDDILTLSKLDSALLLVTPCDVSPVSVVHRALKMFEGEFQTAGIKLEFRIDRSLNDLNIKMVKLDPSRLLQVMINLITNAIKFTSPQEKRVITVSVGASLEPPSKKRPIYISYFPTRAKREDLTKSEEWGTGEKLYMHFAVQDTGRGLSEDETKLLFIRFSQTSPRTHVQYGGSGLGLFISRELVELQGGEIGVRSKAGEGSTFAFYITTRRSNEPPEDMELTGSIGIVDAQDNNLGTLASTPTRGKPTPLSPSSVPSSKTSKTPLSILIVEDNLVNQRVLQKQLRNRGFGVYVANHGVECLDILRKSLFMHTSSRLSSEPSSETQPFSQPDDNKQHVNSPDFHVILMDVEMPFMDGLTCTREIRQMEARGEVMRHVPIIAVTANARGEQIQGAREGGMVSVNLLSRSAWTYWARRSRSSQPISCSEENT